MFSNDNDSLCPDCREIDWRDLIERPVSHVGGRVRPMPRPVKNMEKSHEEMKTSKCRSCQIFSTIIQNYPEDFWNSNRLIYPAFKVTSLELEANLHRSESRHGSVALLTTTRGKYWLCGYLALLGPGIDPEISKIPPLIKDFAWMRNAISGCRQQHKSCANAAPSLHGLRVIDCLASSCTVSVVSVHDACQYAALSYVWGGVHATTTEIPAVVKDAIKVTVELGLKFLWVDQYCIPQNDEQKHRLIRVMDKIYSAACITIVAAAGKTSADGLPGVSTVRQMAQMEIQIDGCTLFYLPAAIDSARASTWASRGWTYQEGLLSTRCLVFTDRGVLYNCRERFVDESLQQFVSSETPVSMDEDNILPTLFTTTNTDSILLRDRIIQYTKRQLSYPQDSLNAFIGIFADYEQQQAGLVLPGLSRPEVPSVLSSRLDIAPQPSHIWGLPLQLGARMLEWYHPKPPKQRRLDFPSWSWTGWEGDVKFTGNFWTKLHSSSDPTFAPTSIEMPNQLKGLHDRMIKGLYVTGATVELKLATQQQTKSIIEGMKPPLVTRNLPDYDIQTPHHHCLLEVSPGVSVAVRSIMSAKAAPQDQIIGLLVTVDTDDADSVETDSFETYSVETDTDSVEADNRFFARSMIVLKQCGQSFTRIGFIDAPDLWEYKLINNGDILPGEKLLHSDIRSRYKFVNIDGGFVDREFLPSSFFDGLSFVQEFVRQRICLE